jgi:hypothetical protein
MIFSKSCLEKKQKMNQNIEKLIDDNVQTFSKQVVQKITSSTFLSLKPNSQIEELLKLWQEVKLQKTAQETVVSFSAPSKKKKSAYQNFFVHARKKINEKEKNLRFGDLSKKVSEMWKQLNADEKKKYEVQTPSAPPKIEKPIVEEEEEDNIIEFTDISVDNQRSTFEEEDEISIDEEDDEEFIYEEDDEIIEE